MLSVKLQKADSIVSRREAINRLRKNSSKSITRKDIMEKDKSVYKQVMFSSEGPSNLLKGLQKGPNSNIGASAIGQNKEEKDLEYISLHKRTIKTNINDPDYEYRIRPVVY